MGQLFRLPENYSFGGHKKAAIIYYLYLFCLSLTWTPLCRRFSPLQDISPSLFWPGMSRHISSAVPSSLFTSASLITATFLLSLFLICDSSITCKLSHDCLFPSPFFSRHFAFRHIFTFLSPVSYLHDLGHLLFFHFLGKLCILVSLRRAQAYYFLKQLIVFCYH